MLVRKALIVVGVNQKWEYSTLMSKSTRELVFGLRFGRWLLREYNSNINEIPIYFGWKA